MDFQTYQSRLSQLSARFNLMVALVFGLLLANILLASLTWYATYNQKIEITPFFGGEGYQKSAGFLDARYLELMSENFLYARLNVTPETVTSQYQRLLTYVDAKSFADMMKYVNHEAQVIKTKKISSTFVITGMKVNVASLNVNVQGVLQRHVGLRDIPPENLTYRLKYRYRLGKLSIVSFQQLKEPSHA